MAEAARPTRAPGRTLAMVRSLPATGSVVIVHNAELQRYVERMIRWARGADVARATKVLAIQGPWDADRLQGLRLPVEIDHAFLELAPPPTLRKVRQLALGANVRASAEAAARRRLEAPHG